MCRSVHQRRFNQPRPHQPPQVAAAPQVAATQQVARDHFEEAYGQISGYTDYLSDVTKYTYKTFSAIMFSVAFSGTVRLCYSVAMGTLASDYAPLNLVLGGVGVSLIADCFILAKNLYTESERFTPELNRRLLRMTHVDADKETKDLSKRMISNLPRISLARFFLSYF